MMIYVDFYMSMYMVSVLTCVSSNRSNIKGIEKRTERKNAPKSEQRDRSERQQQQQKNGTFVDLVSVNSIFLETKSQWARKSKV